MNRGVVCLFFAQHFLTFDGSMSSLKISDDGSLAVRLSTPFRYRCCAVGVV